MNHIHDDMTTLDLDDFTLGYLECARWCGIISPEEGPEYNEEDFDLEDFTIASLKAAAKDCDDFRDGGGIEDLLEQMQDLTDRPEDHMGHDFWLSRNGHGTGFWDRGAGDVGDKLHAAAKVYGEAHVMVNGRFLELL